MLDDLAAAGGTGGASSSEGTSAGGNSGTPAVSSSSSGDSGPAAASQPAPVDSAKSIEAKILAKAGGANQSPGQVAQADGQSQVPPAYQPNFKFKSMDKEYEFDEVFKSVIKDAETEKKVRDLHTRAWGMQKAQEDRETLRGEYAKAREYQTRTEAAHQTLSKYVQSGDFDSFFEALRIPTDAVLKYAVEVAKRSQWSPEQQQAWMNSRQTAQKADYFESQVEQLTASQQRLQINQREFELQSATSRPEYVPIVQSFEAAAGQPGAFRDLVIQIGQLHAMRNEGEDLPTDQAVAQAIAHIKMINPGLGSSSQSVGTQATAPQAQVVQPSQKPVIPAVQGRGASPVRSTFKSLDDLKKRARELEAQG